MLGNLRKYNKQILAVVGVFLMIAFIIPSVAKRDRGRLDQKMGKAGSQVIYAGDYQEAGAEWRFLTSSQIPQQSLMRYLADTSSQQAYLEAMREAMRIVRSMDAVDYLLLAREADKMGTQPLPEIVAANVERFRQAGRADSENPEVAPLAIQHWLSIMAAFDRIADAYKISPAAALQQMTAREEKVSLQLVEFKADAYKNAVAAPDTKQLQAFFDKYRNDLPGSGDFGFGYRYPNRVKLQYVKVPIAEVRKTITMEDVYEAFLKNPDMLGPAATQPSATQPSTQPAAAGTTRPATAPVAAKPTTRPDNRTLAQQFEEMESKYKEQIRDRVAAQHAGAIAKSIQSAFQHDWPEFKQAVKGGKPVASVQSREFGVPYVSYSYLLRLQETIQKQPDSRKVLPETRDWDEFLSARQMHQYPELKTIISPGPLWAYVFSYADPFLTDKVRKQLADMQEQPLALYEPSPVFRDEQGSLYVIRLTAADKEHVPASIDEVAEQVKKDYITSEAYQKAKAAAEQFLATARSKGLEVAAKEAGDLAVLTTPEFGDFVEKSNFPATPKFTDDAVAAYPTLIEGGYKLLEEKLRSGQDHPVSTIALPKAAEVVVARLQGAKPAEDVPLFALQRAGLRMAQQSYDAGQMLKQWLDADNIQKRMNYVPEEGKGPRHSGGTKQNSQEAPPLM